VLWLKNKDVFARFIYCPEASSYTFKIRWRASYFAKEALQNIRLSSAKKRWDNFGPPQHTATPFITSFATEDLIRDDSPSVHKIKR